MAHMLVSSEKLTLAEKALLFWDEMLALGILSEACCHGLCEREQRGKCQSRREIFEAGRSERKSILSSFKKRERERKKGKWVWKFWGEKKTAFVLRGLEFWFVAAITLSASMACEGEAEAMQGEPEGESLEVWKGNWRGSWEQRAVAISHPCACLKIQNWKDYLNQINRLNVI